jgi:hypothetical protein
MRYPWLRNPEIWNKWSSANKLGKYLRKMNKSRLNNTGNQEKTIGITHVDKLNIM